MAIFITGDTHGDFSRLQPAAFHEQRNLTKDDCLIICGDFGGVWDGSDTEQRWLDWLAARPFTTLFVSGNHENFDLLRSSPSRCAQSRSTRFFSLTGPNKSRQQTAFPHCRTSACARA